MPSCAELNVILPPQANAVLDDNSASLRHRNIEEIKKHGRMQRKKIRNDGQRNTLELAMFHYQKILSDTVILPFHLSIKRC